jgi:hypothetical protein
MSRHPRWPKKTSHRERDLAKEQSWKEPSAVPPNDLPIYRLITGKDDESVSKSVSEALKLGYQLYGQPILINNGTEVVRGQAVLWPVFDDGSPVLYEDDDIPF